MNQKLNLIVLLSISALTLVAQHNIYTQLCALNKEWQSIPPTNELLEKSQFSSEQEIITYHLQQVEKHLTKKNINHLPKEIQQRRKEGLEVQKITILIFEFLFLLMMLIPLVQLDILCKALDTKPWQTAFPKHQLWFYSR